MKTRNTVTALSLLMILAVFGRCEVEPLKVERIIAIPSEASLLVGETLALTVTVAPAELPQDVAFSTSDSAVATVDDSGTITATGIGTATITISTVESEEPGQDVAYKKLTLDIPVSVTDQGNDDPGAPQSLPVDFTYSGKLGETFTSDGITYLDKADYFSVDLTGGSAYNAVFTIAASGTDIDLADSAGSALDGTTVSPGAGASRAFYTPAADETYTVDFLLNSGSTLALTDYTFTMYTMAGYTAGNDSGAAPFYISSGSYSGGSLTADNTEDWYGFTSVGTKYEIAVMPYTYTDGDGIETASDMEYQIDIYTAGDTTTPIDTLTASGAAAVNEILDFTVTAATEYRIKVSQTGSTGSSLFYTFSLSDITTIADDGATTFEEAAVGGLAVGLSVGSASDVLDIDDEIYNVEDAGQTDTADWFSVDLTAGVEYTIQLRSTADDSANVDLQLSVFGPGGTDQSVTIDEAAPASSPATAAFTPSVSGTFYLKVADADTANAAAESESYRVRVIE